MCSEDTLVEETICRRRNMKERIQKLLSQRGMASRRQAEQMILQGRVSCNGTLCTLGQSIDPEIDAVLVDGKPLPSPDRHLYIMLHKPKGYVTTLSDEKGRKNAAQLVEDCGTRVYPVGRLDMDSEGLLLFTNDGEFAHRMMHPSHEVKKTYRVDVKGYSSENFQRLQHPIYLDGRRISPPELQLIQSEGDKAVLLVTIHEGRNRQVRRMCAKAGMQVKRLLRVQEGSLNLGNLPAGKWRYLTQDEMEALKL